MNTGKISESILKRSVLKQIQYRNGEIVNGAGIGEDCAIFSQKGSFTAQSVQTFFVKNPAEIAFPIIKATNSVAVCGAVPQAILLSIVLPTEAEEAFLRDLMKEANATAKSLGVQIAGGHTEVSPHVSTAYVSVTASGSLTHEAKTHEAEGACDVTRTGKGSADPGASGKAGMVRPGDDIVVTKWVGLEGAALLAGAHKEKLQTRYPLHMIEEAEGFKKYLSILPEAATAIKSNAGSVHDVSGGGIFAALWELAERAGVGLSVDLKKIPIKQECIEVCEFFGISPYEMLSGGCLLITTNQSEDLVEAFNRQGIEATVIGRITDNNDRVVINEDERRFLERPRMDEITKI